MKEMNKSVSCVRTISSDFEISRRNKVENVTVDMYNVCFIALFCGDSGIIT